MQKKFDDHVVLLEKNAVKSTYFAELKEKFGIKRLGEPIRVTPNFFNVEFPSGACFDLSKISDPWYVMYDERSVLFSDAGGDVLSRKIPSFVISASMDELEFPHQSLVKSNLIYNISQEHISVRVSGEILERDGVEELVTLGFNDDFSYRRNVTFNPDNEIWTLIENHVSSEGIWNFEYYHAGAFFTAIDWKNNALFSDRNWDPRAGKLSEGKFFNGLPLEPIVQSLSPLARGKFILNKDVYVEIYVSSLSFPEAARVFQAVDQELRILLLPCDGK